MGCLKTENKGLLHFELKKLILQSVSSYDSFLKHSGEVAVYEVAWL